MSIPAPDTSQWGVDCMEGDFSKGGGIMINVTLSVFAQGGSGGGAALKGAEGLRAACSLHPVLIHF